MTVIRIQDTLCMDNLCTIISYIVFLRYDWNVKWTKLIILLN